MSPRWRLASLPLLLTLLLASAPPSRAAEPETPVPSAPTMGAVGVPERVSAIMLRQAVATAEGLVLRTHGSKHEKKDRRGLPSNPSSPDVATVPALPPGMKAVGDDVGAFSPQTVGVNWTAATLSGTNPTFSFPPDCMGAVGPSQYVVFVNGRIVTFNKTTGVADGVLNADPDVFFGSVVNGSSTSDARIRYDRISGRWFLVIINVSTPNRILIAVSDAASASAITPATVFTFFFIDIATTPPAIANNCFADYPTLGIDANALYIGTNNFCGSPSQTFNSCDGFVVRKTSILGAGPIVVTALRGLVPTSASAGPYTPQGVDNHDPDATEGYFIGVDNATFGTLMMRRVTDPGGTPAVSGNLSITVPSTLFPILVPHLGNSGGTNGQLSSLDDRLFAAHIRGGRLWTAHNIGVNNTGVASGTRTRNGSRWYELNVPAVTGSPTLVQSGTVYTPSATNTTTERHYWVPSIMVSGQGHAALGFSTAGSNERANSATVGRLAGDVAGTMQTPVLFTASSTAYNPPGDPGSAGIGRRWGDYTYTSLDPLDDMTMWTVQQFCNASNSYGVRVAKLVAPPPATPSALPDVTAGQSGVPVTLTGTVVSGSGFFDPGPDLPGVPAFSHLSAAITNGAATGTPPTVVSATVVNPTTVNLVLDATAATPSVGAERYTITVTNPDGQTAAAAVVRVIPGGPTVSLAPAPVQAEGNAGTTAFPFTVNVSPTSPSPITVRWQTVDGTATAASGDYAAAVDSVVVPANTASAGFSVNVNGDVAFEPLETFSVSITSATGATVGAPATVAAGIQNDDAQPVVNLTSTASTAEGDAGTTGVSLIATLSNPSGSLVTADWSTGDGTATTADADYVSASGAFGFAPGETADTIVVVVNGDGKHEADETFAVGLDAASGATIGAGTCTVTIANDDAPPSLSVNDVSALETHAGTTVFSFTVSLSAVSGRAAAVDFETADSTATLANGDYASAAGTLSFAPGTTTQPVTITVNGDATLESDEVFLVRLSNASGATIGVPRGVGTIVNDDAVPVLSVTDASVAEGDAGVATLVFAWSLSNATDLPVSVRFATGDLTATAGADYVAVSDTLVIPAKATSGTVTVDVTGDLCGEADETLQLTLSDPVNTALATPTAQGTITNDDDAVAPSVAVVSPNGGESFTTGTAANIQWNATDDVGVAAVDILLSRDGGASYAEVLATAIANSGTFAWNVTGPGTTTAFVRVVATDGGCNAVVDSSDAAFTIAEPSTGAPVGPVTSFALGAIRPNPTPGEARIEYQLPREAAVRLSVVDVQGREVVTLARGTLAAGRYTASWNGLTARGPAPRGVYFVRYQAGGRTHTKRLVLSR